MCRASSESAMWWVGLLMKHGSGFMEDATNIYHAFNHIANGVKQFIFQYTQERKKSWESAQKKHLLLLKISNLFISI